MSAIDKFLINYQENGLSFIAKKIPWDSKIYSNNTFEISDLKTSGEGVKMNIKKLLNLKLGDLLIAKIDIEDKELEDFLLSSGFYFTERMLTFEILKSDFISNSSAGINLEIRKANADDIDEIKIIASNSIDISHYHADGNLKKSLSSFRFSYWVESSYNDKTDDIWVLTEDGHVLGFCIMRNNINSAQLSLIAVKKDRQGKGLGKKLLANVINKYLSSKVKVITNAYLSNKIATQYYKSIGFRVIKSQSVYHYFEK